MKAIQEALAKLPPASVNVVAALENAGAAMATESKKLGELVVDASKQFGAGTQSLVAKLHELPPLLDPSPVVQQCSDDLEQAFVDLKELANQATTIPSPVIDSVASFSELLPTVQSTLSSLEALPNRLKACAPDGAWVEQSTDNLMAPLSAWRQVIADATTDLNDTYSDLDKAMASWSSLPPTDQQALAAGQAELIAKLNAAKLRIDQLFEASQSSMSSSQSAATDTAESIKEAINASVDDASGLIDSVQDEFLSPIRDLLEKVTGLQHELHACSDNACTSLDALNDKVGTTLGNVEKPVSLLKEQLDTLTLKLCESSDDLRATLAQALAPIDALTDCVDNAAQALDQVASAVDELVNDTVAVLDELCALIAQGKQMLQEIPDNFELVRDKLQEAMQQIEAVRQRIPVFVSQALGALDTASAELSKAEDKCTNAIAVCTKYQLKVPSLMVARGLFMSAKASLGPIKASVKTAAGSVKAAGVTADDLVGQALDAAHQIDPLILDAKGVVQQAVDQVASQLDLVDQRIGQAKAKVLEGPPFLNQQLEALKSHLKELAENASDTAHKAVDSIELEPVLDNMQAQLDDLTDKLLGAISKQTDQAKEGVDTTLSNVKTSITEAADKFDQAAQPLIQRLEDVPPFLQGKADDMRALVRAGGDQGVQWVDDAHRKIAEVFEVGASQIDKAQTAWQAYCERCQSSLEQAGQAAAPALSAANKGMAALQEAKLLVFNGADVDEWVQTASEQVNGNIKDGLASADQASAQAQAATQHLETGKQAADDQAASLQEMGSLSNEANTAIADIQESAKTLASKAESASAQADADLDKVNKAAENVQSDATQKLSALADENKKTFDAAGQTAQDAKASQEQASAEFKKANSSLTDNITATQLKAQSLTAQAQASCDDAKSEVAVVKAKVDAVKANLASAESVLAAEVVKQGGAAPVAPEAAAEAPDRAANSNAAKPAQGSDSKSSTEANQSAHANNAGAQALASDKASDAGHEPEHADQAKETKEAKEAGAGFSANKSTEHEKSSDTNNADAQPEASDKAAAADHEPEHAEQAKKASEPKEAEEAKEAKEAGVGASAMPSTQSEQPLGATAIAPDAVTNKASSEGLETPDLQVLQPADKKATALGEAPALAQQATPDVRGLAGKDREAAGGGVGSPDSAAPLTDNTKDGTDGEDGKEASLSGASVKPGSASPQPQDPEDIHALDAQAKPPKTSPPISSPPEASPQRVPDTGSGVPTGVADHDVATATPADSSTPTKPPTGIDQNLQAQGRGQEQEPALNEGDGWPKHVSDAGTDVDVDASPRHDTDNTRAQQDGGERTMGEFEQLTPGLDAQDRAGES